MKHNPGATHLGAPTSWEAALRIWARVASLALPLTMLSALLYLVGVWSPWAYVFETAGSGNAPGVTVSWMISMMSGSSESFSSLLSFIHYGPLSSPLILGVYGVLAIVWDALPFCGILLSLALWQRRGESRPLAGVYVGWLVFATAVAGVGIYLYSCG